MLNQEKNIENTIKAKYGVQKNERFFSAIEMSDKIRMNMLCVVTDSIPMEHTIKWDPTRKFLQHYRNEFIYTLYNINITTRNIISYTNRLNEFVHWGEIKNPRTIRRIVKELPLKAPGPYHLNCWKYEKTIPKCFEESMEETLLLATSLIGAELDTSSPKAALKWINNRFVYKDIEKKMMTIVNSHQQIPVRRNPFKK